MVAKLEAPPGTKIIRAARRIFHRQNFKPLELDTVAKLEALPGTGMTSPTRCIFCKQNLEPS